MNLRVNDQVRLVVVATCMCTLIHGCGKKDAAQHVLPQPKVVPHEVVQKKQSSASVVLPRETSHDFSSQKDPFKPYKIETPKVKLPLPPISQRLLPIQQYEVNQFKILGIVVGLAENRAMVVDPMGKSYVLKEGMLIGRNNGRVLKIGPSALEITEQFREDTGKIRNRVVTLPLPRKE